VKSTFICLANSKKYGERCIAGILVSKDETGRWKIIRNENQPKWIRPVSNREHGEVKEQEVKNISLLDVVEADIAYDCPNGYQSENKFFRTGSLRKVSGVSLKPENLDLLVNRDVKFLFGGTGKAVSTDEIKTINHSLVLIKANNPEIIYKKDPLKPQYRIKFIFNDQSYELPITDVNFIEAFLKDQNLLLGKTHFYFTVSLGVVYEGWHYKLVAGIIAI